MSQDRKKAVTDASSRIDGVEAVCQQIGEDLTPFSGYSVELIGLPDITPTLARESGFLGVLDLLKVAKHGKGELIYLVRFHFVLPSTRRPQKVR